MTFTADEQRLHDVLVDVAGDAAVDTEVGRRAAGRALRRRTRRRAQRRVGATAIVTLVVVVTAATVIGRRSDHSVRTVASTVASSVAPTVAVTVAPPSVPRTLTVLDRLTGRWAPEPFAFDGTDVWLAHDGAPVGSRISVVLERRDATSGHLLGRVVVPQEAAFALAAADGSVWVVGGGDGGVADTTVSRIDIATRRVQFTRTLPGARCACPIAVGVGGVWIGGQGATSVLRVDETTGAVSAQIPLPHPSASLAVVADRLQVGLDDSRVAIVDPATNRVERVLTVRAPGHAASGPVLAIDPIGGGTSRVTRGDGIAFEIVDNRSISATTVEFLRPLGIGSSATIDSVVWAAGVDQLFVATADDRVRGYANYDATRVRFGPVRLRSQRFAPTFTSDPGLDRIIAAGNTLWIATFNGPVLVVAPS